MTPGEIIETFTSKSGKSIVIRYPNAQDADVMLDYINTLSREDTYINFAGEQITRDQEEQYLQSVLSDLEQHKGAVLMAFDGATLVGECSFKKGERRREGTATLGISIKKEYRGEGIGKELMKIAEKIAQKMNVRIFSLSCLANNETACKLYEGLGYQKAGSIPKTYNYRDELVDELIWYKEL